VCAGLLARIRVPARAPDEIQVGYLRELREGWREFTSRTWLWTSVVFFGIGNMVSTGSWGVLGPVIAKADLGGAGTRDITPLPDVTYGDVAYHPSGLAIGFTVFPIIAVPSPFLFAAKVIAVSVLANVVGAAVFFTGRRRNQ